MKLIVCSFQAAPERGSEYAVGWGWVRLLAERHTVALITNDAQRAAVEEQLTRPKIGAKRIECHFVSWSQKWVGSVFWPAARTIQYAIWRQQALRKAKELANSGEFDACHHVNGVGFRDVVPLWKTGLPFVWGPVGGAVFAPRALLAALGWRVRLFFAFKNRLNRMSLRLARRPRQAAAKACAVIAATAEVQMWIARSWRCEAQVVPEVGTPQFGLREEQVDNYSTRAVSQPLQLIWCARLVEGKALNLLLHALTQVPRRVDWMLEVIGDGPMRSRWEKLAGALGIANRVHFRGALSRDQVIGTMCRGHVFVMTSVYDLTTNAFCEALSCGLPVVCLSHQAAAGYVGSEAGIVVPVDTLASVELGLAQAIAVLFDDERQRQDMARNALAVSEQFSWQRKARVLERIYAEIAATAATPPV